MCLLAAKVNWIAWQQYVEPGVPWVVSELRASSASVKSAICFPEVSSECIMYMVTAPADMPFAATLAVRVWL